MLTVKTDYEECKVYPVVEEYKYGGVCVQLMGENGEPFATLTVCLNDYDWNVDKDFVCPSTYLPYGVAYIDTNNCPWAEDFIKDNNLGVGLDATGSSGFCTYPLYRLNMRRINDFEEEATGNRTYTFVAYADVQKYFRVKAPSIDEANESAWDNYCNGDYDDIPWDYRAENIELID